MVGQAVVCGKGVVIELFQVAGPIGDRALIRSLARACPGQSPTGYTWSRPCDVPGSGISGFGIRHSRSYPPWKRRCTTGRGVWRERRPLTEFLLCLSRFRGSAR